MQSLKLDQNTQEWLNWRKDKIGASDIPIILGLSPYCTPYLLWRRKLGFAVDQKESIAMKRGKELEPLIREEVNRKNNFNFEPSVCSHENIEWAVASLDGIDEEKKIILEVKCTSKDNHELAKSGEVCQSHFSQVQWQLFITGYKKAIVAHYYEEDIILVEIKRDDEYIEKTILPAAINFYRCLIEIDPPEINENEHVFIQDPQFEEYANKWKEANRAKKEYEKQEKIYREALISLTDDGNCVGYGVKISRIKRQGNIEWERLWKTLSAQHPEICEKIDLESYRKEGIGFWKIEETK